MKNHISILGSTGSIGMQTLEVVRTLGNIKVDAITTNTNIDIFEKQINEFKPSVAVVVDDKKAYELKKRINIKGVEILSSTEGLKIAATVDNADMVVNSVVGKAGLEPTIAAIRAKKNIALANKETLVAAGEFVMNEIKINNVKMYPVDSEHSAIFQCLQGNNKNKIYKIHLTASGGPFKGYKSLDNITVEDALKHPNWNMGKKITIDSATLMNKGLEVIEAKWLFNINEDNINVVVHPQSIIHSMVEYEDGAVIAQLGLPDMKLPIQYALTYPKRVKNNYSRLNFFEYNNLTFEKPDMNVFRCLYLAFEALKEGGTMTAVLNGANEACVNKFLSRQISFSSIPMLIEKTMSAYNVKYNYSLEDVIEADNWARNYIETLI